MNSTLGDALENALKAKKSDYSNFVWKGEKRKEGKKYVQEQIKMIDMTPEEIIKCHNHCKKMLYNDDPKHLGRYNVLDEVIDQINKCNVELLLRYYENGYRNDERRQTILRSTLNITLRALKANNPEIEDWSAVPITKTGEGFPAEFDTVNVADALEGCIYCLGAFDKQHLTMAFITKMGLWFTKAEENELRGETNSNVERVRIAKERLHLPNELVLKFNERGLSFHEMRAMLTIPKKQRYNDMTTEQLVTLRDKVLPRLLKEVDNHIFSWKKLKKQLELVAKSKEIELNDD